jgi:hypothetical protein
VSLVIPAALFVLPERAIAHAEALESPDDLRLVRWAWPLPWLQPGIEARIHALYERSIDALRARQQDADPRAIATLAAMLRDLERLKVRTVPVYVEFARDDAIERADAALREAARRPEGSRPTVPDAEAGTAPFYLRAGLDNFQEPEIVAQIARTLSFNKSVLALQDWPVRGEAPGSLRADAPSIWVRYRFTFDGEKLRTRTGLVYLALGIEVRTTFQASAGEPFTSTVRIEPPREIGDPDLQDPSSIQGDQVVYERMTSDLLREVTRRFPHALLATPSP